MTTKTCVVFNESNGWKWKTRYLYGTLISKLKVAVAPTAEQLVADLNFEEDKNV